jgi:hypothetical protein
LVEKGLLSGVCEGGFRKRAGVLEKNVDERLSKTSESCFRGTV